MRTQIPKETVEHVMMVNSMSLLNHLSKEISEASDNKVQTGMWTSNHQGNITEEFDNNWDQATKDQNLCRLLLKSCDVLAEDHTA